MGRIDSARYQYSEDTGSVISDTENAVNAAKMAVLRKRWANARIDEDDIEDIENSDESFNASASINGEIGVSTIDNTSPFKRKVHTGGQLWGKLRKTMIISSSFTKAEVKSSQPIGSEMKINTTREDELATLVDFWEDSSIPPPPPYPVSITPISFKHIDEEENEELDEDRIDLIREPVQVPVDFYFSSFESAAKERSLNISKLPREFVEAQRVAIEAGIQSEQIKAQQERERREADLKFREHAARERIKKLEADSYTRLLAEKEKTEIERMRREASLGAQFRKAKYKMEEEIKAQEAEVREKYGEFSTELTPFSREFVVRSSHLPQTIEIRIHTLRAVKSKLPYGSYVILASMYDRLGGTPLGWKNINPIEELPNVTSPVLHRGRYFDRVMKFEESVFLVCPSRSTLKPSYCIVFELFELKNGARKQDRLIAWTVSAHKF